MPTRSRALALAALFAFVPIAAAVTPPPDATSRLAAEIERAMAERGVPGIAAAVATGSGLVWTAGFGVADVENGTPVRPDTSFRIASVSKTMTAVAALQLWSEGRLDLDAPVQAYCPSFPAKPWPLTARHLLAHTGGVRHYVEDAEMESTKRYESTVATLAIFADDPLVHEPGAAFTYTTYGYNLLGCVVEGAAGKDFVAVLAERIWTPLGLAGTGPDDQRAIIPRRAQGYELVDGQLRNATLADTSNKIPGGGLVSTAPDLATYGAALLSGRLLTPAAWAAMIEEQVTATGEKTAYGLGMILETRDGLREVFHTGGQQRVNTVLYLLPEKDLVIVLLANLEASRMATLARSLADILLGRPSVTRDDAARWYDAVRS